MPEAAQTPFNSAETAPIPSSPEAQHPVQSNVEVSANQPPLIETPLVAVDEAHQLEEQRRLQEIQDRLRQAHGQEGGEAAVLAETLEQKAARVEQTTGQLEANPKPVNVGPTVSKLSTTLVSLEEARARNVKTHLESLRSPTAKAA